jgi:hypothetical protein
MLMLLHVSATDVGQHREAGACANCEAAAAAAATTADDATTAITTVSACSS